MVDPLHRAEIRKRSAFDLSEQQRRGHDPPAALVFTGFHRTGTLAAYDDTSP